MTYAVRLIRLIYTTYWQSLKYDLDKLQFCRMDVQATRLNWYRDSSEWKPFHHDAAAMKPDKVRN